MHEYQIKTVTKKQSSELLLNFHYLKDISKGFKSGFNYGLFDQDRLIGVVIFTSFPVPELVKGMFGLERNDQEGMFELSRLVIHPDYQGTNKNIASFFVSKAIKILIKETKVRCILSYADSKFHVGTVYQACNFKYYGINRDKKDFFIKTENGFVKHSRGKVKGIEGEWRPRSPKHRYAKIFDTKLKILWEEKPYPKRTKNV